MGTWITNLLSNVVISLIVEFVMVVLGVIVGHLILARWEEWRYGGWSVVVRNGDRVLVRRRISPRKAKEILSEPAELSVFLKGVVSPYARIHCDLIEEGKRLGVLVEDRSAKQFTIDLAKDLPRARGESVENGDVL